MLIVHVHVRVKPTASTRSARRLANARDSVQEPGVARFDVVQPDDDPTRFVLVEVYRSRRRRRRAQGDGALRRLARRVAPLMAEPRTSAKYRAVFPDDPWR